MDLPPSSAWGARTHVGGARYAPGMAFFVLTMVNGPRYDPARARREQDGWDEHAAFMDGLTDAGFAVLGGPIGDGNQVMVVVEAAGRDRGQGPARRRPVGGHGHPGDR